MAIPLKHVSHMLHAQFRLLPEVFQIAPIVAQRVANLRHRYSTKTQTVEVMSLVQMQHFPDDEVLLPKHPTFW